jgi:predicted RNA binding protein YcfA (HicA-like mRNA interferase family)
MSRWPSAKARDVLLALERIGWKVKRQSGSHKTLARERYADVVFAFHDRDEIGARLAKHTGLVPEDL